MNERRKGISLIVLVITILVMIILAGVVVVSLQKNNPIEKAKTSKDITNLSAMKEELELYKTNQFMLEKNSNITADFNNASKIINNIPSNLNKKVMIFNGELGVCYSEITEEAQEYAIKNDIFDAEDKIAPDLDVYVEIRDGKKYVICDSIDHETDVARIYNEETKKEIKPNTNFEKILILADRTKNKIFTKCLRKKFRNVELKEDKNVDTSKYNVVIGYGGPFSCIIDDYFQKVYVNKFKDGSKENPSFILTGGNDTKFWENENHIFESFIHKGNGGNFEFNTGIDDIVMRKIKETKTTNDYYTDNSRYAVKFKNNDKIKHYVNNIAFQSHPDCTGMYLDKVNKKGWFHMQECGHWDSISEVELSAKIYKAAITKMTGSRSMEIDVTGVASGTKYSFIVTDLAGNEITKEITL